MEHAVLVTYPLSEGGFGSAADFEAMAELSEKLRAAIEAEGVGEFDGNELGGGECVLFMYGPNADRLHQAIGPGTGDEPSGARRPRDEAVRPSRRPTLPRDEGAPLGGTPCAFPVFAVFSRAPDILRGRHMLPEAPTEDRLRQIADDMLYLLSQDMLDGELDRLQDKTPIEIAEYFYLSSDCDAFADALIELTGGDLIAVSSAAQGPIHRLVRLPDRQLADAGGIQTLETLAKRYGLEDLSMEPTVPYGHVDEDELVTVHAVMASLPHEPFVALRAAHGMTP